MPDADQARERRAKARAEREETAGRRSPQESTEEHEGSDEARGSASDGADHDGPGGRKVAVTAAATAGGVAAGFGLVRLLQWVRGRGDDDAGAEQQRQSGRGREQGAARGGEEQPARTYDGDELGTALKDVALDLAEAVTDAARRSKAKVT